MWNRGLGQSMCGLGSGPSAARGHGSAAAGPGWVRSCSLGGLPALCHLAICVLGQELGLPWFLWLRNVFEKEALDRR